MKCPKKLTKNECLAFFQYPHVGHRAVTPSCHPPSIQDIEAVWREVENSGIDPEDIIQEYVSTLARVNAGESPSSAITAGHGKKKRSSVTVIPRTRRTSTTAPIPPVIEEISEASSTVAEKAVLDRVTPPPVVVSKPTEEIQEKKKAWGKIENMAVSQPISVPSPGRLPLRSRNKPW